MDGWIDGFTSLLSSSARLFISYYLPTSLPTYLANHPLRACRIPIPIPGCRLSFVVCYISLRVADFTRLVRHGVDYCLGTRVLGTVIIRMDGYRRTRKSILPRGKNTPCVGIQGIICIYVYI